MFLRHVFCVISLFLLISNFACGLCTPLVCTLGSWAPANLKMLIFLKATLLLKSSEPTSLLLQLDLWWKKLAWPGTLNFKTLEYLNHCQIECKPLAQTVNLPAMQGTGVWSLHWEDPLEKGMATHSSILAWKIPWTKEPRDTVSWGSVCGDTVRWVTESWTRLSD